MIAIMTVLLLPFATWRISSVLHREDGPFCIAQRLREIVGVKYDDFSAPYGENVFSQALACMWCLSVWVALVLMLFVVYLPQQMSAIIVAPFGLSALAIIVDELIEKG